MKSLLRAVRRKSQTRELTCFVLKCNRKFCDDFSVQKKQRADKSRTARFSFMWPKKSTKYKSSNTQAPAPLNDSCLSLILLSIDNSHGDVDYKVQPLARCVTCFLLLRH